VSDHYGVIAFREAVRGVRQDHGSHAFNNQKCVQEMAVSGTEVLAGRVATWNRLARGIHTTPAAATHCWTCRQGNPDLNRETHAERWASGSPSRQLTRRRWNATASA